MPPALCRGTSSEYKASADISDNSLPRISLRREFGMNSYGMRIAQRDREMATRTNRPAAPSQVPIIQLYNDRLATAVDLQRQGQPANWNVGTLNFIGLYELFHELNEDVEDYLDLFAERALPVTSSTQRVVTTWSHFLAATRMAQSRALMSLVPAPRSLRFLN